MICDRRNFLERIVVGDNKTGYLDCLVAQISFDLAFIPRRQLPLHFQKPFGNYLKVMLTPLSSPSIPSVPRGTPSSTYRSLKARKAPIHNPYDKFTQPEFDAWIGDITGVLRRALGQESFSAATGDHLGKGTEGISDRASEGSSEGSLDLEDSFADVKARQAKGKARDPREGPGIGGKHDSVNVESESDAEEDSGHEFQHDRENSIEEQDGDEDEDAIESSPVYKGPGINEEEPIVLTSDEEENDEEAVDTAREYFQDGQGDNNDELENAYEEGQESSSPKDVNLELDKRHQLGSMQSAYSHSGLRVDQHEDYGGENEVFVGEDVDGPSIHFFQNPRVLSYHFH